MPTFHTFLAQTLYTQGTSPEKLLLAAGSRLCGWFCPHHSTSDMPASCCPCRPCRAPCVIPAPAIPAPVALVALVVVVHAQLHSCCWPRLVFAARCHPACGLAMQDWCFQTGSWPRLAPPCWHKGAASLCANCEWLLAQEQTMNGTGLLAPQLACFKSILLLFTPSYFLKSDFHLGHKFGGQRSKRINPEN